MTIIDVICDTGHPRKEHLNASTHDKLFQIYILDLDSLVAGLPFLQLTRSSPFLTSSFIKLPYSASIFILNITPLIFISEDTVKMPVAWATGAEKAMKRQAGNSTPTFSPEYVAYSNAQEILAVTGCFATVALIVVLLRCYVRIAVLNVIGKDDYMMVLAMVSVMYLTAKLVLTICRPLQPALSRASY